MVRQIVPRARARAGLADLVSIATSHSESQQCLRRFTALSDDLTPKLTVPRTLALRRFRHDMALPGGGRRSDRS